MEKDNRESNILTDYFMPIKRAKPLKRFPRMSSMNGGTLTTNNWFSGKPSRQFYNSVKKLYRIDPAESQSYSVSDSVKHQISEMSHRTAIKPFTNHLNKRQFNRAIHI